MNKANNLFAAQIINQSQVYQINVQVEFLPAFSTYSPLTPLLKLPGGEQAKVDKTTIDAFIVYGNVQPGESVSLSQPLVQKIRLAPVSKGVRKSMISKLCETEMHRT